MEHLDKVFDYQLEIVASQLDDCKCPTSVANMPDIERLLSHRYVRSGALKVQELIWSLRRLSKTRNDLAALPQADPGPRKPTGLYLDVTALHRGSTQGGVRRLSRQIVKHSFETALATPTYVERGRLMPLGAKAAAPIEFACGDVFVIVSFFWEPFDEYKQVIARAKAAGAHVAICVHDAIPALYPGLTVQRFHREFASILLQVADLADMIVTLSQSSADTIRRYLSSFGRPDFTKPVRWFYMGSDATDGRIASKACLARRPDIFATKTFLTVGTLAPHKGVPLALTAFERCWSEGLEANYLIVGQADDYWTFISSRITNHPQYGRRLFWFDDFDDAELADAYERCHCYIQPSVDEGFGIPIVEAASYERPIIASDIPVFREIGSADILYFARCDASDLANKIADACVRALPAAQIRLQDWRQSFLQLVSLLQELQTV